MNPGATAVPRRRNDMKHKCARAVSLVTVAGLLLSACGSAEISSDAGSADEGFRVLALAPLSGPLATLGALHVAGLESAAAVLNDHGGVDGRDVEIDAIDNAGDAAQAVRVLQESLADDGAPDMLVPGVTSQEIMAVLPLATQNELLTVHLGSAREANDPDKFPYVFGVGPTQEDVAGRVVEHFEEEGYENVAFLGIDATTSRLQAEKVEEAAAEADMEATVEIVAPDSADVSPALLKLRATNPDVLYLAGSGPIAGVFLSGLEKVGWDGPVLGSTELCQSDLSKLGSATALALVELNCYAFAVEGQEAASSDAFTAFRTELAKHADSPLPMSIMAPAIAYNDVIVGAGAYLGSESDEIDDLVAALTGQTVPQHTRDLFVGPTTWDYAKDDHSMTWSAKELIVTPSGPQTDGLLKPSTP
jgi:branched-chain amino acid transport system substrate-binding protein